MAYPIPCPECGYPFVPTLERVRGKMQPAKKCELCRAADEVKKAEAMLAEKRAEVARLTAARAAEQKRHQAARACAGERED